MCLYFRQVYKGGLCDKPQVTDIVKGVGVVNGDGVAIDGGKILSTMTEAALLAHLYAEFLDQPAPHCNIQREEEVVPRDAEDDEEEGQAEGNKRPKACMLKSLIYLHSTAACERIAC